MPEPMKALCVLNPAAAGGLALERWPSVADLFRNLQVDLDLFSLTPGGSFPEQVAEHLSSAGVSRYDAVAGIGGDGTQSAVINGLMRFRERTPQAVLPPYAFIPIGTGNDIAKSFGIRVSDACSPRDLRRAVEAVVHGADYFMDLGTFWGLYFADAVTIGLDSRILRERNVRKRAIERIPLLRHLARGRWLYTLSAGAPFFRQVQIECRIVADGSLWYAGPMINVVVNNTRIYAGDFDFSVDAFADDGLLDVVLFTGHTDYLAQYLLAIRRNPERVREFSDELYRHSRHCQARHVEVHLSGPEPAQVDGEELPEAADFDIGIAPRAIHIKTPVGPV